MARPQPIVIPGGLSSKKTFTDVNVDVGALVRLFDSIRNKNIEARQQEEFPEQFGSVFEQQVPAAGPQLPAGGIEDVGIAQEGAELAPPPTAAVVPEDVQALGKLFASTPQGRAEGRQFATEALKAKLAPTKTGKREILKDAAGFQRFTDTGERVFPTVEKPAQETDAASEVQSSEMLPSGLVQIVRKNGDIELKKPTEADKILIEAAEKRGSKLQGLRAGEREEAKSASKQANKAFTSLSGLRKNISNLDKGITEIDRGAKTGAIEKRFPSIRAASVRLKQVQQDLGLDIIQNTTFGALSEGELELALDTALPTGLNETELRDWMVAKRDAQKKLMGYIEESAIFLGTPGNTIAKFLTQQKAKQQTSQPAAAVIETLPEGATQVGTSGGKKVFKVGDKTFIED
jgi:hypothetical protein